jgi:hypothetical protein
MGVVGTDVTLAMTDVVLSQTPLQIGRVMVLDPNGALLADSGGALKGAKGNVKAADIIASVPQGSALAKDGMFVQEGETWMVLPLRDTSWRLVVYVAKSSLMSTC